MARRKNSDPCRVTLSANGEQAPPPPPRRGGGKQRALGLVTGGKQPARTGGKQPAKTGGKQPSQPPSGAAEKPSSSIKKKSTANTAIGKEPSNAGDQVRYWQRTTDSIVPFLSIARLVKQIADDINSEESDPEKKIRFQKEAIIALRDASEDHLNILFQSALFGCIHAKRVTLHDKDIRLVKNIAEMHGIKVYQPWDKEQSKNMLQKRMTHSLS